MTLLRTLRRAALALAALPGRWTDRYYLAGDAPVPRLTTHPGLPDQVVAFANRPGFRVLEIGSREVTGASALRARLDQAEYVGFDYYPGPNVDVAGDAHRLASQIEGRFDAVYSSAVFEHLAMPWVVAEEIAKVLKPGGRLFLETHFAFSSHERPWHFFHFTDMGLRALFSPALGFECVEASLQNPIVGRFSHHAARYLRGQPVKGLYCHATLIAEKVRDVAGFDWRNADFDAVVGATRYPPPEP